jgi:hypothetical protein
MQLSKRRTFLELRVGTDQLLDVVLHIRARDWSWFHEEAPSVEQKTKFEELLDLLQSNIVPRVFQDEIELLHETDSVTKEGSTPMPRHLGPGGIPIVTGENNDIPATARGKKASKRPRQTKKQKELEQRQALEVEREQRDATKDVRYAFGTTMRLAYRLVVIPPGRTATLVFAPHASQSNTSMPALQALTKLSKRLHIWCSPYRHHHTHSHSSSGNHEDALATAVRDEGSGFYRPEMIPVSNLFRMPAEEET